MLVAWKLFTRIGTNKVRLWSPMCVIVMISWEFGILSCDHECSQYSISDGITECGTSCALYCTNYSTFTIWDVQKGCGFCERGTEPKNHSSRQQLTTLKIWQKSIDQSLCQNNRTKTTARCNVVRLTHNLRQHGILVLLSLLFWFLRWSRRAHGGLIVHS